MSSMARNPDTLTEAEYLAFERSSEFRHEFLGGHTYQMAGASREHNLIVSNLVRHLGNLLDGDDCEIYSSNMKVRIPLTNDYTYPDVVLACGEVEFLDEKKDVLLTPSVIIEVLSPSTEAYDRGEKFRFYRSIPYLNEYILVSQSRMQVDSFTKLNNRWVLIEPSNVLALPWHGGEIPLSDIYHRVLSEE